MGAAKTVIVVGLGNPGSEYAATRHNVGHLVLDELASRARPMPATFKTHKKTRCDIAEIRDGARQLVLAKPRSYMNVSGGPVAAVAQYFSVRPEDVIVVHDELDVDFGTVRLKRGGGEGGHNGLRSISNSLGTKDYLRVRVGISRPPGRMDPASYVLKPFASVEKVELPIIAADAADAVEALLELSLTDAQNRIHAK